MTSTLTLPVSTANTAIPAVSPTSSNSGSSPSDSAWPDTSFQSLILPYALVLGEWLPRPTVELYSGKLNAIIHKMQISLRHLSAYETINEVPEEIMDGVAQRHICITEGLKELPEVALGSITCRKLHHNNPEDRLDSASWDEVEAYRYDAADVYKGEGKAADWYYLRCWFAHGYGVPGNPPRDGNKVGKMREWYEEALPKFERVLTGLQNALEDEGVWSTDPEWTTHGEDGMEDGGERVDDVVVDWGMDCSSQAVTEVGAEVPDGMKDDALEIKGKTERADTPGLFTWIASAFTRQHTKEPDPEAQTADHPPTKKIGLLGSVYKSLYFRSQWVRDKSDSVYFGIETQFQEWKDHQQDDEEMA